MTSALSQGNSPILSVRKFSYKGWRENPRAQLLTKVFCLVGKASASITSATTFLSKLLFGSNYSKKFD